MNKFESMSPSELQAYIQNLSMLADKAINDSISKSIPSLANNPHGIAAFRQRLQDAIQQSKD